MQKRLYVLIDSSLDPIYGCVQAGHAVAQWLLDNKDQSWNNQYLIYLKVDDIQKWIFKLQVKKLKFTTFKEPDLNNQITALAIEHDGSIFEKLKLVGT